MDGAAARAPRLRRPRRGLLVGAGLGLVGAALVVTLVALPHGFLRGPQRCHVPLAAPSESELVARFGPALYSQGHEELLIRDFFDDAWRGFFVDVGAGDYRHDSTTYFLEHHRAWRGLALDANPAHAAGYARHRPRTTFLNYFVSDTAGGAADFAVHRNPVLSSGVLALPPADVVRRLAVPTTTLDRALAEHHVTRIDFLSIDVEGAEAAVLRGFDVRRYRPTLVCIEVDKPGRASIDATFRDAGYRELTAYHDLNEWNAFFTPAR